jgi:hypothetical protein
MTAGHGHTTWCAKDHRCNLGEHRSHPLTHDAPGAGGAVLTRIRSADGTDYAEIRVRITLPRSEADARTRLVSVLTHIRTLIGPPRIGRGARRAA